MKKRIDTKLLLYSFAVAFCLLFICSKCSPLYPFNDWVDVHCFLTVGRGIKHGMVPYRDLYEQKGPLLYFVVAIATFISETSFVPLFLIEVLAVTVFIYKSLQIVFLWTEGKVVYAAAPFVFLFIFASPAFAYGFSAEELCLPFLAWPLQIVLKRMRHDKVLTINDYFIIGICAAVPLWTKYIFCGYYIGLALVVAIWYIRRQDAKAILRALVWSVAGLVVMTVAVLAWYAVKGALPDLFEAYFFNNITAYSDSRNLTWILFRLVNALFKENFLWVVCGLFGIAVLALDFRKNQWEFLAILAGLFMLIFFILLNRFFWTYYTLILALFTPLVLIPVSMIIGEIRVRLGIMPISIVAICMATGISWFMSPNTYMVGYSKQDLPQYAFADIMYEEKDNPTLLNYDFLDGGFYYAAGILPVNRYSCKFNVVLPEQMEEQDEMLNDGITDYVVTRGKDVLPGEKYQMIASKELFSYPDTFTYYLFERIPESEVGQ